MGGNNNNNLQVLSPSLREIQDQSEPRQSAKNEIDLEKISMSSFLDEKFDIGENEGAARRTELPRVRKNRSNMKHKVGRVDLDAQSELRLNQVLFKDGDDTEVFEGEPLLSNKKTSGKDTKIKKLVKDNKALRQQIIKLKEVLSTDKNLRQMKEEYSELFSECKQIV